MHTDLKTIKTSAEEEGGHKDNHQNPEIFIQWPQKGTEESDRRILQEPTGQQYQLFQSVIWSLHSFIYGFSIHTNVIQTGCRQEEISFKRFQRGTMQDLHMAGWISAGVPHNDTMESERDRDFKHEQ